MIASWHSLVLDDAITERHSIRMFLPRDHAGTTRTMLRQTHCMSRQAAQHRCSSPERKQRHVAQSR